MWEALNYVFVFLALGAVVLVATIRRRRVKSILGTEVAK